MKENTKITIFLVIVISFAMGIGFTLGSNLMKYNAPTLEKMYNELSVNIAGANLFYADYLIEKDENSKQALLIKFNSFIPVLNRDIDKYNKAVRKSDAGSFIYNDIPIWIQAIKPDNIPIVLHVRKIGSESQ